MPLTDVGEVWIYNSVFSWKFRCCSVPYLRYMYRIRHSKLIHDALLPVLFSTLYSESSTATDRRVPSPTLQDPIGRPNWWKVVKKLAELVEGGEKTGFFNHLPPITSYLYIVLRRSPKASQARSCRAAAAAVAYPVSLLALGIEITYLYKVR